MPIPQFQILNSGPSTPDQFLKILLFSQTAINLGALSVKPTTSRKFLNQLFEGSIVIEKSKFLWFRRNSCGS
jgi:hypothetical protein